VESFWELLHCEVLVEKEPVSAALHSLLDVGVFIQRKGFEDLVVLGVD
jgi:hypothetical protein